MDPESGIESAVADLEGADRIRTGVSPLTVDSSDKPPDPRGLDEPLEGSPDA